MNTDTTLKAGVIYREYRRLRQQGFSDERIHKAIAESLAGDNWELAMQYVKDAIHTGTIIHES